MSENNTLYYSKIKMEGAEYMDKEYEETQKEIDKLLYETSQVQTHKKYKAMKKDKKYNEKMEKIAELTLKLEEEHRKDERRKTYT